MLLPCVPYDRVCSKGFDLRDYIEFAQNVGICVGTAVLCIFWPIQLPNRLEPMHYCSIGFHLHRRVDPATTIMTDHNHVLDVQHIDGKSQSRSEIWIICSCKIGHIAMDKHFSRIEIDDLRGRHSAI